MYGSDGDSHGVWPWMKQTQLRGGGDGGGTEVRGGTNRRLIAVVYDPSSSDCQEALRMVQLRESSLPKSPTVELIEWPSDKATEILLAVDTKLREASFGEAFDMAGKMIAVLPNGVVIPHCVSNVMELIYEMEYMTMVRPALPETKLGIEAHLSQLQASRLAGEPGKWWRSPGVISKCAAALHAMSFCILDDFLDPEFAETFLQNIKESKPSGSVPLEGKGGWGHGTHAHPMEASTKANLEKRMPYGHTRSDIVIQPKNDQTLRGTERFCATVDDLIMGLKSEALVAERLVNTDFANAPKIACYPGGSSRFIKHIDNVDRKDGRRLTTIIYLNKGWEPSHGGHLRVFDPNLQSGYIKRDIEPIFNRLLVFWSTPEVPHEVMPAFSDRYAATVWYMCARECLETEAAFNVLRSMIADGYWRCMGGQDPAERLIAAGQNEEQRRALRLLVRNIVQDPRTVLPSPGSDNRNSEHALATLSDEFRWNMKQQRQPTGLEELLDKMRPRNPPENLRMASATLLHEGRDLKHLYSRSFFVLAFFMFTLTYFKKCRSFLGNLMSERDVRNEFMAA